MRLNASVKTDFLAILKLAAFTIVILMINFRAQNLAKGVNWAIWPFLPNAISKILTLVGQIFAIKEFGPPVLSF